MSSRYKGGPAFPVSTADADAGHQDGHATWQFPGMTLRDYFAAKAMQMKFGSPGTHIDLADMAAKCFAMADAMLAERLKS